MPWNIAIEKVNPNKMRQVEFCNEEMLRVNAIMFAYKPLRVNQNVGPLMSPQTVHSVDNL